jgi:predicted enzyme involved in methoxymalonyl-ACP biosynthesis
LMSCRVMARGVGTVLISYIMQLAKDANVKLQAEFVFNGRNRMMHIAYAFANFQECERRGDALLFENDLSRIPSLPGYIRVITEN